MSRVVRLTRSGWEAHDITQDSLLLRYQGKQAKPSQTVIRYYNGQNGYTWPEIVPPSVQEQVRLLLEEAHENTKSSVQRLAEAYKHHQE
jgi:hypothetical protein